LPPTEQHESVVTHVSLPFLHHSRSLVFSNAPSASQSTSDSSLPDANTYQPFQTISDAVLSGFRTHLLEAKDELSSLPSQGVVSALSQALCHINRLNLSTSSSGGEEDRQSTIVRAFQSRVLILTASPDSSSQYVSVMNCIFGAQKKVSTRHGEEI
jgi:transcription initiation factor TFIIH subunit 3